MTIHEWSTNERMAALCVRHQTDSVTIEANSVMGKSALYTRHFERSAAECGNLHLVKARIASGENLLLIDVNLVKCSKYT